jgi:tetratricopeptide (TPR) repeat protein
MASRPDQPSPEIHPLEHGMSRDKSFWADLARRGVIQTLGVYVVAAWAAVEVASTVLPYFGIPDSAVRAIIVLAALGAPVVAALAWVFQITPSGIERTDSAEATPGDSAVVRVLRGRLPLVLGVVVVLGSAGAVVWARLFAPAPARADVIAVLPFQVHGDSQRVGQLGEGMVTLLSRELDGVAGLRSVDPSTMLSLGPTVAAGGLAAGSARTIADGLGAARFVVGSITEVAGRVVLAARMYGPDTAVDAAVASVEGDVESVFTLAEDLLAQLLAQQMGPVSRRLTGTAARATESLSAFKAFVDAEQDLRRNDYSSAIAGFQAAVDHDSSFALAHYRLALAASLRRNYRLVQASLEASRRFVDRMSVRDERTLAAFESFRAGRIDEAEARYTALLDDYPDHWEARFLLGELLTEHNPPRGRSAREALPLLEAVVRIDPAFVCPTCTLANFALASGDLDASDSISYSRVPKRNFRTYVAASAAARGDSAEFAAYYRPTMNMFWQGPWLAAWFGLYDRAEELVRPTAGPDRPDSARVYGLVLLADLDVARGRWGEVPELIRLIHTLSAGRALLRRAFLLTQPLADPPASGIDRAIDDLERWAPDRPDPLLDSPLTPLLPHGRAYLLGLLHARAGRSRPALAWADSLARIGDPPDVDGLANDLALTVRADLALQSDDPAAALRLLDRIRAQIPVKVMDLSSPGAARLEFADLFTQEHARLLRVQALERLERFEEARRWIENGFFRIGGNPLLAPTLILLEAQVREGLSDTTAAIERYDHFIALWEGADPDLQRSVEHARARRDALAARSSS